MFLNKQIEGKVVECIIRREYMLPRRFARGFRDFECDYDYEYDHRDEYDNTCDYYVEYQSITVSFEFYGEERVEKFDNITLHSHYKNSDRVILVYNRWNKAFRFKG